jgi:hypothetical protein
LKPRNGLGEMRSGMRREQQADKTPLCRGHLGASKWKRSELLQWPLSPVGRAIAHEGHSVLTRPMNLGSIRAS